MWVAVSVGNSPRAFSHFSILPTLPGQRECQGWPFPLGGHSASSSTSSDSGGPSVWWTPKLPHHGGTCGALIFLVVSPSCWPATSLLRAEPVTYYSLSPSVPRQGWKRGGTSLSVSWVEKLCFHHPVLVRAVLGRSPVSTLLRGRWFWGKWSWHWGLSTRESCKLKSVEVTGIPAGCGILVLALLPHIQHPASGPPAVLSIWYYRFLHVVTAPVSPSGLSIAFGDLPSWSGLSCPISYVNSLTFQTGRGTLLWYTYFPTFKLYFRILSYKFGKWRKIKVGDEWSILKQASRALVSIVCKFNSTGWCIENYKSWDDHLHVVYILTACKWSFWLNSNSLYLPFHHIYLKWMVW